MKKISKTNILILGIIILVIFVIFEIKNIQIDNYNFKQLEKAKIILDTIPNDDYKFYTLKKFNKKYNINIEPIKNCYYISNDNGNESYIFAFKLESIFYRIRYLNKYYIYPKYDIPVSWVCVSGPGGECFDSNYRGFIKTISNPCKE